MESVGEGKVLNPGGAGVTLSFQDDGELSWLTVGLAFDGVDCGGSLCALSCGSRWTGDEELAEKAGVTIWEDGTDADAGANDLFHDTLGKGGHCLSFREDVSLSMDG